MHVYAQIYIHILTFRITDVSAWERGRHDQAVLNIRVFDDGGQAKFNSSQSKRKWKGPAGPNSIQVKVRSKSFSLKIPSHQ